MQLPPPVPGALPLLGHILAFGGDRQSYLRHWHRKLGNVFALRFGPKNVAVLIGPEQHEVFFKLTDTALRMDKAYGFLRAMFGEVAFTAPPEVYNADRPILHLPFRGAKMEGYVGVMDIEIQRWLDQLGEEGEFELVEEMKHLTQQIAAHALMGRAFREEMGEAFWSQYDILARSISVVLPAWFPTLRHFRRDIAKRRMRRMLEPILDARHAAPDLHDDFLQDFVTAKYKDGTPLSDEKIMSFVLGLLFAGHETTAGQASWALLELVRHPELRQRVDAEIAQQCPPGQRVTLDVLARMDYLRDCVRETERLHPVTDLLMRYVEEDIEAGGYRIPKGWLVMTASETAHRDPAVFRNPHVFDPARFAPGRAEDSVHRFSMITFGGATHKCTGMNFAYNEMMAFLILLLREFDLELMTAEPHAVYDAGASRPSATYIRYRRKPAPPGHDALRNDAQAVPAACPHLAKNPA